MRFGNRITSKSTDERPAALLDFKIDPIAAHSVPRLVRPQPSTCVVARYERRHSNPLVFSIINKHVAPTGSVLTRLKLDGVLPVSVRKILQPAHTLSLI